MTTKSITALTVLKNWPSKSIVPVFGFRDSSSLLQAHAAMRSPRPTPRLRRRGSSSRCRRWAEQAAPNRRTSTSRRPRSRSRPSTRRPWCRVGLLSTQVEPSDCVIITVDVGETETGAFALRLRHRGAARRRVAAYRDPCLIPSRVRRGGHSARAWRPGQRTGSAAMTTSLVSIWIGRRRHRRPGVDDRLTSTAVRSAQDRRGSVRALPDGVCRARAVLRRSGA